MSSETSHTQQYLYTPSGIAHHVKKVDGFSESHKQAAAHALLRHLSFSDRTEDTARHRINGLHLMYIAFHDSMGPTKDPGAGRRLLHDMLMDVFDAVSETCKFVWS